MAQNNWHINRKVNHWDDKEVNHEETSGFGLPHNNLRGFVCFK